MGEFGGAEDFTADHARTVLYGCAALVVTREMTGEYWTISTVATRYEIQ